MTGEGWCLIGGAVLRNEPLVDAVERHVRSTLGDKLAVDRSTLELRTVIEYFTQQDIGEFHDPRKHAVALTYVGICEGEGAPTGEALEFDWFRVDQLSAVSFGFGQDAAAVRALGGFADFVRPVRPTSP